MAKKIRQAVGALLSLAVLFGAIFGVSEVVKRPDSSEKYYDFFEEDTDYDVFFLGSSHGMNAFFPMQLWNDYGFTSYNFGNHASTVWNAYWVLKNAIEYHKPKVVVIDTYSATWTDEKTMDVSQAHFSFDAFPLTWTKIQGLRELFTGADFWEMVFPFSVYHSRWSEVTAELISRNLRHSQASLEKGGESRINVAEPKAFELIPREQMDTEETRAMRELRELIEFCKEQEMEVVLVNIPSPVEAQWQEKSNAIQGIADDEGVPYLNLQYENLIDFDIDLYDSHSHVNPAGARKVTEFVGKYLAENTDLADKRSDPAYVLWNADYEKYYSDFLVKNIRNEKNLNNVLMLLNNENFTADIVKTSEEPWSEVQEKLLEAVKDTVTVQDKTPESTDPETPGLTITIYNASHETVIAEKFFESTQASYKLVDNH